jgi:putative tryptophan/tyrosine transport system substrate-binding protein
MVRMLLSKYRWAGNDTGKLQTLVEDLVHRQVAVIATGGNSASIVAAAVKTIPVVFAIGFDPVQSGIVSSLSRPSANATGITTLNTELGAKWLGLFTICCRMPRGLQCSVIRTM